MHRGLIRGGRGGGGVEEFDMAELSSGLAGMYPMSLMPSVGSITSFKLVKTAKAGLRVPMHSFENESYN